MNTDEAIKDYINSMRLLFKCRNFISLIEKELDDAYENNYFKDIELIQDEIYGLYFAMKNFCEAS